MTSARVALLLQDPTMTGGRGSCWIVGAGQRWRPLVRAQLWSGLLVGKWTAVRSSSSLALDDWHRPHDVDPDWWYGSLTAPWTRLGRPEWEDYRVRSTHRTMLSANPDLARVVRMRAPWASP